MKARWIMVAAAAGMAAGAEVGLLVTEVAAVDRAAESYWAEGYDYGVGDGMTDGFAEGRQMVLDVLASCQEDEVVAWIAAEEFACTPVDDAEFTADRGWVAL